MSNDARRLAAMVDSSDAQERGNLPFRKDFASQTKALFESFGAPLAGMSDAPFADLLRTMSTFPSYSLGNQSLIALQGPASVAVSSMEKWEALGRSLVLNPRAIYIWAPTDNRAATSSANGFARPSLDQSEKIARSLGLRPAQDGEYEFDARSIGENALWGSSQTWRTVRSVRISEGGDHIAVKLVTRDGRSLERRARTMVGLVKALMQAGTSPNDETIAGYLARLDIAQSVPVAPRNRDFFQRFKMVPVYDVSETHGPELPQIKPVDFAAALANLTEHLGKHQFEVIQGDHDFRSVSTGDAVSVYLNDRCEPRTQLAYLLDVAADALSARRAQAQARELLRVERDAVRFVLYAHFGFDSLVPELGAGLAPNVEPHSFAEVVKARLSSIHDISRDLILAACPAYENPLLKALALAREPAQALYDAPTVEPAKTAEVRKLRAPKTNKAKASIDAPVASLGAIADGAPITAAEDFNPFAEVVVQEEEAEFNPFADSPAL